MLLHPQKTHPIFQGQLKFADPFGRPIYIHHFCTRNQSRGGRSQVGEAFQLTSCSHETERQRTCETAGICESRGENKERNNMTITLTSKFYLFLYF